jgi:hypothetical protein
MESLRQLQPFHLALHRRPAAISCGVPVELDGCKLATITLSSPQQAEPFSVSFETATERLAELPQLFVEPDGSFVWVSPKGSIPAWQVDGVVNDRADRVVSVEAKGTCPRLEFEQLLRAFDWPETRLVMQLVEASIFLEDAEYLRCAEQLGWH